ncbi:MAG TPA: plastocyanin/azurin family copper-binding protein [Candidatus Thermoplasmatota archaeon]|nr:plastocyanin/azurin family copper-binding protein [Candidatus Thermoplasmatota archaeon]
MRAWALPVASILLAAAFAGCVNTPKDTEGGTIDPASTGNQGTDGGGTGQSSLPTLLPPLALKVSSAAPQWVAPGTSVEVSAAPAQSGWTYVWSIGPLPGTVAAPAVKLDTGSAKDASDWIQPGASASLTFTEAGVFEMHCHPHPDMRANVTVIDGYAGPKEVHVQIVDGASASSYRFVPENVVVAPGTKVTYTNNGTQPHTATLLKAEPKLKKLDLATGSGAVTVEGDGWQRIRLVATDAAGRMGVSDFPLYVKPLPAYTADPITVEFQAGGLPGEVVAPFTHPFTLAYNGTLNLTWAFKDAVASNGGPVNNAEVDIHVFPEGSEQDVITSELKPEGEATAKVVAGTYTLQVVPKKGVGLTGTITLGAVYADPVPPAPTMAGAGGGDGHGGHAH